MDRNEIPGIPVLTEYTSEGTVNYSHNPAFGDGFKEFKYTCKHIPTDKELIKFVMCRNTEDFKKLINHWNKNQIVHRWIYTY